MHISVIEMKNYRGTECVTALTFDSQDTLSRHTFFLTKEETEELIRNLQTRLNKLEK